MKRGLSVLLTALLAVTGSIGIASAALADINNATGTNVQSGNNRSTSNQSGTGKSGSSVGGQVTGVVSSGRASVDARNTSTNSDVTSGDARGSNTANSFTGQNVSNSGPDIGASDIANSGCSRNQGCNVQDGDNRLTQTQTANATTGDGVAGEVIGVVASGSASIVAANRTDNSSVETGDARADNSGDAFVGQVVTRDGPFIGTSDLTDTGCSRDQGCNLQSGSNRGTIDQSSTAHTGDGVGGQVIGGVSAGSLSIDGNNTTTNSDITTGDARSSNDADAFVGQALTHFGPSLSDITDSGCSENQGCNLQDGNNRLTARQASSATTGDGVGGEVIGAVTSAGGSASIVAANTTSDSSVDTGDAHSSNDLGGFVGQVVTHDGPFVSDVTNSGCDRDQGCNLQDGDNRLTASQSSNAATGDGVAGQVIGVVSAGAASVDARNTSTNSDVTTGDSHSTNDASLFVGQALTRGGPDLGGAALEDVNNSGCFENQGCNVQDGSNTKTLTQNATATSGDGVAGQVTGVVTSAGGSASVVVANSSDNIDATSGDGNFSNTDNEFVGQVVTDGSLSIF
jgi:hypothetical protein